MNSEELIAVTYPFEWVTKNRIKLLVGLANPRNVLTFWRDSPCVYDSDNRYIQANDMWYRLEGKHANVARGVWRPLSEFRVRKTAKPDCELFMADSMGHCVNSTPNMFRSPTFEEVFNDKRINSTESDSSSA